MIKLKTILSEGYAWEREAGKPLPTLADTTAAYQAKLKEQSADQPISNPMSDSNEMISARTHVVYACNVQLPNGDIIPGVRIAVPKGPNAEQEVLARIDDKFGAESVVRSISKAMKPSDNSNDRDYGIDTTSKMESADAKPDYIDLDGDGDEEESMRKAAKDKKSDMNESFILKLKKNLIGGALRK
jgi:hypothetical protein